MSRTYRNRDSGVPFCNNCNKPLYGHYKDHYENCTCKKEVVHIKISQIDYDEYGKRIVVGSRAVERKLPIGTYLKYNLKALDGIQFYPQHKGRKEAQQYRNSSFRRKNKLTLKQNIPYEDMIFPVNKKQVDRDVY